MRSSAWPVNNNSPDVICTQLRFNYFISVILSLTMARGLTSYAWWHSRTPRLLTEASWARVPCLSEFRRRGFNFPISKLQPPAGTGVPWCAKCSGNVPCMKQNMKCQPKPFRGSVNSVRHVMSPGLISWHSGDPSLKRNRLTFVVRERSTTGLPPPSSRCHLSWAAIRPLPYRGFARFDALHSFLAK